MTQNQAGPGPDAPSPAPDPEPTDLDFEVVEPREPAEPAKFPAPEGVEGSGRFAAYDTTLGKYVGGTHSSRADAKKAGKGAASFEVVEV